MSNQKGEVVTGVMVFMMVVMMVFGGMHLMHRGYGEHRNTGERSHHEQEQNQHEKGHDHQGKGQQDEHLCDEGNISESGAEENK